MSILVILLTGSGACQRFDGMLQGSISDPDGAAIANAHIIVRSEETGWTRKFSSGPIGRFHIPNLIAGQYTVTIQAPNFSIYRRDHIQVRSAQVSEVNAVLRPGTETSIEVSGGQNC
ncbi:MAG: carboxypeptidase-like regulatory domain-containing protein [Candidatus Korobacteraceae bacterium]